jgi:hypothetical protein
MLDFRADFRLRTGAGTLCLTQGVMGFRPDGVLDIRGMVLDHVAFLNERHLLIPQLNPSPAFLIQNERKLAPFSRWLPKVPLLKDNRGEHEKKGSIGQSVGGDHH